MTRDAVLSQSPLLPALTSPLHYLVLVIPSRLFDEANFTPGPSYPVHLHRLPRPHVDSMLGEVLQHSVGGYPACPYKFTR